MLERLLAREPLDPEAAAALLDGAVGEHFTPVQLAALLTALQAKGAAGSELAAFARVLRKHAVVIGPVGDDVVDTCGTGGGAPSFNLSTGAAIVAAAAGAKVAKHGNRAVTSSCGSADVLEALGVRLGTEPEKLLHLVESVGIAFLFAPNHHPALKAVGPVRKELGVRTVFNQLGPLANPAGARRQVIGVYDGRLIQPMAEALAELGTIKALVVHADDGLDEVSPCTHTRAALVSNGSIASLTLNPIEMGLSMLPHEALKPGETVEESAAILREALSDPQSLRSQALLPSSAAALWMAGVADGMAAGVVLAREAIASGAAKAKLEQLIEVSEA